MAELEFLSFGRGDGGMLPVGEDREEDAAAGGGMGGDSLAGWKCPSEVTGWWQGEGHWKAGNGSGHCQVGKLESQLDLESHKILLAFAAEQQSPLAAGSCLDSVGGWHWATLGWHWGTHC